MMMTVGELIEKLKLCDPALPVVAGGFDESGYDMLETVEAVTLVQVNDGLSHSGKFEKPETITDCPGYKLKAMGEPFRALYLDR